MKTFTKISFIYFFLYLILFLLILTWEEYAFVACQYAVDKDDASEMIAQDYPMNHYPQSPNHGYEKQKDEGNKNIGSHSRNSYNPYMPSISIAIQVDVNEPEKKMKTDMDMKHGEMKKAESSNKNYDHGYKDNENKSSGLLHNKKKKQSTEHGNEDESQEIHYEYNQYIPAKEVKNENLKEESSRNYKNKGKKQNLWNQKWGKQNEEKVKEKSEDYGYYSNKEIDATAIYVSSTRIEDGSFQDTEDSHDQFLYHPLAKYSNPSILTDQTISQEESSDSRSDTNLVADSADMISENKTHNKSDSMEKILIVSRPKYSHDFNLNGKDDYTVIIILEVIKPKDVFENQWKQNDEKMVDSKTAYDYEGIITIKYIFNQFKTEREEIYSYDIKKYLLDKRVKEEERQSIIQRQVLHDKDVEIYLEKDLSFYETYDKKTLEISWLVHLIKILDWQKIYSFQVV